MCRNRPSIMPRVRRSVPLVLYCRLDLTSYKYIILLSYTLANPTVFNFDHYGMVGAAIQFLLFVLILSYFCASFSAFMVPIFSSDFYDACICSMHTLYLGKLSPLFSIMSPRVWGPRAKSCPSVAVVLLS
jgi:hypothetical protein